MSSDWLANLKVGDLALIDYDSLDGCIVTEVVRFTPQLIIVKNDVRFKKKDGKRFGVGGSLVSQVERSELVEPTEARCNIIKHRRLYRHFGAFEWKALPLETLRKIAAFLPEKSK